MSASRTVRRAAGAAPALTLGACAHTTSTSLHRASVGTNATSADKTLAGIFGEVGGS